MRALRVAPHAHEPIVRRTFKRSRTAQWRFLFIDDEIPDIPDWKRPKIFDPLKHGFNPLNGIDYRKAREIADVLYTVYPQGENTLTVRNGKRALLKALLHSKTLDKIKGDEEVSGMIGDILASPVLRGVFCEGRRFTFNPKSANLARINRAELGRFDSLILGLLLIAQFKGQLVLPSLWILRARCSCQSGRRGQAHCRDQYTRRAIAFDATTHALGFREGSERSNSR